MKKKVVIVGGGASGLVCAIRLKQINPNLSVTILEKNDRVGKKILKTGNGRCNLSNLDMKPIYYNCPDFIEKCFNKYSVSDVIAFFNNLGLLIKTDDSTRLYPYSETATSVLDILRRQLGIFDINVKCETMVTKIKKTDKFYIEFGNEQIEADYLVLACGSSAQSNTNGYLLAESLKHKIIEVRPGLVPLKTKENLKSLRGIRVKCLASVIKDNNIIYTESGELLFKDQGISGILTLNLSRYTDVGSKIIFDFAHTADEEKIYDIIESQSSKEALIGILPKMLADKIGKNISQFDANHVLFAIRNYQLIITGTYGFNQAQIALGGVDINEINDYFSSKKINNLFIIGELLDIDGACGGYNLHFAWISGLIAAETIGFEKK
ncbi:MAG: aminoacetone oxidase family FAD-binding enzyme [Bacilli bacterium]|nr:aminoacetone oxidase family FAD-binding enzyme [Bacilli bacterium]MDD4387731.1 aminoacetone oxidase family FAD-binding enzyme [Bacilli bacterium]